MARLDAYREMLQAGFRTTRQGVVMERNAEPGSDVDDWLQAEAELREPAMNKYGTED